MMTMIDKCANWFGIICLIAMLIAVTWIMLKKKEDDD